MILELKLPDVAEQEEISVIVSWHVQENEKVVEGQDLLEISTDKATFDVPAPFGGVLIKKMKEVGAEAVPGDIIALMEREDGAGGNDILRG
ncbi:MAG: hypothetical protein PHH49_00125 [Candidatus Omnitrophica bacterium]|nr:hypothetical protein [Candidatus Omnitrophota bacterium]MDD5487361.1 hypothetical protein [Candidatus Omnitrophota bacterium]